MTFLFNLLKRLLRFLRAGHRGYPGDLRLGRALSPAGISGRTVLMYRSLRTTHATVLGRTGSGKTSLLRYMAEQDIRSNHGFLFIDLHGQTSRPLLSAVVARERRQSRDRSGRLVYLDPSDRDRSAGINVLEAADSMGRYRQAAEIVGILKARWHLDAFGARTEELLRNSLLALMEAGLTLLELEPFLTDAASRRRWLAEVKDPAVTAYFRARFESLSVQMRAVMVEPVLNKLTAFTADPHIRHLLGQQRSTVDFAQILDEGHWVVLNLDKGRLGSHALTLGSLILARLRKALFARSRRAVFTLYCDEIQNLVVYDQGLEDLFAEARKFGISVVAANQYLDQLTPAMRAALLATGSQFYFRLAEADAHRIAYYNGGGASLAAYLKELPQRRMMGRVAGGALTEIEVPILADKSLDTTSLIRRSAKHYARDRSLIESEILARRETGKELDGWE